MEKIELIERLQNCTSFSELLELDCDLDTHFGITVGDFIEYMDINQLDEWAKEMIDGYGIFALTRHLDGCDMMFNYFTFNTTGKLKNLDDTDFQKLMFKIGYHIGSQSNKL